MYSLHQDIKFNEELCKSPFGHIKAFACEQTGNSEKGAKPAKISIGCSIWYLQMLNLKNCKAG